MSSLLSLLAMAQQQVVNVKQSIEEDTRQHILLYQILH
jgi:hypothetical protein